MEYRQLGHSGLLVSNLALGTMNFGTRETPEAEAFAQLDAFLDAGGNLIDTADVYNGGVAEAAQRDRTANGPEALGALVKAHAKGDHDGVHPAR
jgi:aryl-alcohol dehydrogenase-like predicted oxidoreductase